MKITGVRSPSRTTSKVAPAGNAARAQPESSSTARSMCPRSTPLGVEGRALVRDFDVAHERRHNRARELLFDPREALVTDRHGASVSSNAASRR